MGGGGGGGSGTIGGVIPGSGGGAGGLIFLQNQTVDSGTYTISVGKGGNKAKDNTETGHNGCAVTPLILGLLRSSHASPAS